MKGQSGIFSHRYTHRIFLEFSALQSSKMQQIKSALLQLQTHSTVETVIGFGKSFSQRLHIELPRDFHDFETIRGINSFIAPSTQHDIFVWIQGEESHIFETSFQLVQSMQHSAALEQEINGFNYRESMDLIAFEDGSANPKGQAIFDAALVSVDEPGSQGSVVLTQKWVHNLPKFFKLSDHEQSQVVGRDKHTNMELTGNAMPANSHISRTDVNLNGVATKVWRRSSPYGTPSIHGLYFLSFACDQQRHQLQLDSMYGLSEDGVSDRLLEFSSPVSGAYYFAPSNLSLSTALGR